MLELEGPRVSPVRPPVEPSGPSHGWDALAAPTPRETQRTLSSDDEDPPAPVESFPFGQIPTDATLSESEEEDESEEWSGPRIGLVRRGRGGGRPVRRHARPRRRLPANPFVEMEAEEGDDDESEAEPESPPRSAFLSTNTQTLTASNHSDKDSSDSDTSVLNDSFIVPDDSFE